MSKKKIFICSVVGVAICVVLSFVVLPALGLGAGLPVISLPAETLVKDVFPGFNLTNSFPSMLLVDVIVLALALVVWRATRGQSGDSFVPRGIVNVIDAVVEFLDNQSRETLGEKASRVLPLALTVFLFVLTANLVKLMPGTETVGIVTCAESGQPGYPLKDSNAAIKVLDITGGLKERAGVKATEADTLACEKKYPQYRPPNYQVVPAEGSGDGNPNLLTIVPFFRALATDLNMPLALALTVWVTVETWGIQELGLPYFLKFLNLKALWNVRKHPMGIVDFLVGVIEAVTELMRLMSLSFRLLGAMLAGTVLMVVVTYLIAFGLPLVFTVLEIVMAVLQAYIFATLTIIYAGMAIHHQE